MPSLMRAVSLLWMACIATATAQEYPDPKRFESEILRFEQQDGTVMTDIFVYATTTCI
jgi:hypothetical protein